MQTHKHVIIILNTQKDFIFKKKYNSTSYSWWYINIYNYIWIENFPPPNEQHNNYETILNEETKIGEIEYTKNLIKALKEAIDENDRLRESAAQLVEENNKMRNELDEKDNIIRELGEYYQVRYI